MRFIGCKVEILRAAFGVKAAVHSQRSSNVDFPVPFSPQKKVTGLRSVISFKWRTTGSAQT